MAHEQCTAVAAERDALDTGRLELGAELSGLRESHEKLQRSHNDLDIAHGTLQARALKILLQYKWVQKSYFIYSKSVRINLVKGANFGQNHGLRTNTK